METKIPWTTAAEVQYLNHIGAALPKSQPMSRAALLRGYVDGANRRTEWGEMDKAMVLKHAYNLLTQLALEEELKP